jgi:steroid 5-alpha reductase family enzyme
MNWVWVVSLPVTILNSPNVQQYPQHAFGTGRDIAGIIIYAIGLAMETLTDFQEYYFRTDNSRSAICDKGGQLEQTPELLWRNYYSIWYGISNLSTEQLLLAAIYMIAVSAAADGYAQGQAYNALSATIVGPFFLTILLMFLSGLPMPERPGAKKQYEKGDNWDAYARYLKRTSIIMPFPPQIYENMPIFLKRTIFLEFSMYIFDPAKHSDVAKDRVVPKRDMKATRPERGTKVRVILLSV